MKKILFIIILIAHSSYAQLHTYYYKQQLQGVNPNAWHKITLPENIFGQMKSGYADLRIYGVSATDTIEIPYLLDKTDTLTQKQVYPISIINFKQQKQTNIKVQLPYPLRLSKVSVTPNVTYDYYRTLNLVKEGNENIKLDVLSSKKQNIFTFPTQLVTNLQVIIINNDNEPLPIDQVAVYVMPYTLKARFASSAYIYYLAYGKANDYPPTYDIAHFPKDIPQQLTSLTFGQPTPIAPTSQVATTTPTSTNNDKGSPDFLWAMMGVIVAIIFIAAAKMLKSKK